MADDYIKREDAYKSLLNGMVMTGYQSRALDCISEFSVPAADVVPVRHGTPIRHFQRFCNSDGEVIREIMDGWECPFCQNTGAENYCPNCGAKMDGGDIK